MRSIVVVFAVLGCGEPTSEAGRTPGALPTEVPGHIADPGQTVMTVDGVEVGKHETDRVLRSLGVPEDQLDEAVASPFGTHVLEDYALATALYRRALDEGLHEDPDVQLEIAFAARQALARAMQQKLTRESVSEADLEAWIEANAERLDLAQARARVLLVPTEAHAKDLMARLEAGERFAQLAEDHSMHDSASRGGELGWFTQADQPDIGGPVFAHRQTNLFGPVPSDRGYYVVEVLERRDGTPGEERRQIARRVLEKEAAAEVRAQVRDGVEVEFAEPRAHLPAGHPPAGSEG